MAWELVSYLIHKPPLITPWEHNYIVTVRIQTVLHVRCPGHCKASQTAGACNISQRHNATCTSFCIWQLQCFSC